MYRSKIPFSRDLEDVCTHMQTGQKSSHREMHIIYYGHTETHAHNYGHEIPAIVYTQKHLHSIMDKEIHTIMDSKIHRNTHTKRGTHTYMNLHIKSPHEKGFNVYTPIRDTQHMDPILSSIFAVPKPLWPHRHSQGLLSTHAHPLFPRAPPP